MDTYQSDQISDANEPDHQHSLAGDSLAGDRDHDDFWAAFDEAEEWAANRPTPWYRKVGLLIAAIFVFGMLATSAFLPWGEFADRIDNVEGPIEIQQIADETVAESPYSWLVEDVRVRDIIPSGVGGFVHGSPGDGIITIDLIGWDPQELRSTVAHEIGHLLDFAARTPDGDGRNGLETEVWAECAAVDAGFRRTDPASATQQYRCTPTELEQYQFSVSLLGEICAPWNGECRVVSPIGAD